MQRTDPDPTLNALDRARLAKLLGMVGSAHDGEALNAARLADQLVRARALQWADVLSAPANGTAIGSWRDVAETCVSYGAGVLSPWEISFCRSLLSFPRISDKQRRILRLAFEKLGAMT
jgi:hypothetical protein